MSQTKQPDGAAAKSAAGGIDLRTRTPADMALQLTRNATSLELVDASTAEADRRFYDACAADMREAAAFLEKWQSVVDALQADGKARHQHGRLSALLMAAQISEQVASLMPERIEGPANTWRSAACAIGHAIMAIADSNIVIPEVRS